MRYSSVKSGTFLLFPVQSSYDMLDGVRSKINPFPIAWKDPNY